MAADQKLRLMQALETNRNVGFRFALPDLQTLTFEVLMSSIEKLIGIFLILTAIVQNAFASDRKTAESIAHEIFVGQAYVSGNVYVKGFTDGKGIGWPDRMIAAPLRPSGKKGLTQQLQLTYSRLANKSGSDEYTNFPVKERAPGEDEYNHPPDVFATVLDSAVEDRDIGIYRSKQSIPVGFSVLAWKPDLSLDVVDFGNHGKPRPMTKAEKKKVADIKKIAEAETKNYECTTVPAFLDSAREILTSKVKGTDFSFRISEYSNPGCAGHLEEVYVLDVWETGKEPARFEFHHYYGAI